MSATLHRYRDWVYSGVSGALSPHIVIAVWGAIVAAVWVPAVQYLWEAHHVRVRDLPVDVSWLFDAVIGIVVGVLISLLTARLARTRLLQSWLIFIACFFVSALIPFTDLDLEQVGFALRQPIVVSFVASSWAGFWFQSRAKRKSHAP